jgi:hypothetical protein
LGNTDVGIVVMMRQYRVLCAGTALLAASWTDDSMEKLRNWDLAQ